LKVYFQSLLTAICSPSPGCLNGGTCTSPNVCQCYIGGFGNQWQGSVCQDHLPSIITQTSDTYYAICYTVAGGDSTASTPGSGACQYTHGALDENPLQAVDGNVNTKYLNYGYGSSSQSSSTQGTNTGFYVTPLNGISVLKGILFATANDSPERDPITCTVEGSNYGSSSLSYGWAWTLIYSGTTGIPGGYDPGRLIYMSSVAISNNVYYTSYRILITSQRGVANSVQYSEAHLLGY
ncbi:unnamed protein product, partial [Didymodactylos carnosus]